MEKKWEIYYIKENKMSIVFFIVHYCMGNLLDHGKKSWFLYRFLTMLQLDIIIFLLIAIFITL
jgi:hypothetical protein